MTTLRLIFFFVCVRVFSAFGLSTHIMHIIAFPMLPLPYEFTSGPLRLHALFSSLMKVQMYLCIQPLVMSYLRLPC